MKTIKLYGELKEKFGNEFTLKVETPAEAIRALCANLSGFEKFLKESESRHVSYQVIVDSDELENNADLLGPISKELKIVPVVIGANAEARTLIGAALIAGSFIFTAGLSATAASLLLNTGSALAISGISQMIAPQPKNDLGPREAAENTPNYTFNGPVNTTAQGHPVPVGYGRLIVGGAVISAGISLTQVQGGKIRKQRVATRDQTYRDTTSIFVPPENINWLYRANNDATPINNGNAIVYSGDIPALTEPAPYLTRTLISAVRTGSSPYTYTYVYRYTFWEYYLEDV